MAWAMRGQIGGDGLEPIVLILGHPWFGADEQISTGGWFRGLFVQHPDHPIKPPLASRCDKWESVVASDVDRLPTILGALIR